MIDLTDAEYVDYSAELKRSNVVLKTLEEDDAGTIFNTVILEKDKEATNG